MSLGTFCLVLATLLVGGYAQNAGSAAQVPKTYSLSPFLDPLGLTRPRPALFSLTSVPIGRLPFFGGLGVMQGLYPMGQGATPNNQTPGATGGAQGPGANVGANGGAQSPGANVGVNGGAQGPGANVEANGGAQSPGASAGATAGTQGPGANVEANGGAQSPGASAGATAGTQVPAVTAAPANN